MGEYRSDILHKLEKAEECLYLNRNFAGDYDEEISLNDIHEAEARL